MARLFSRLLVCAFALFLVVPRHAQAALTFPPLTGRVVDDANVLSADTKDHLTALLAQEEKQTGNQVVVATLPSLQDDTIEDYGYQLGRHWGIGQKGKNTGALLIVVPSLHKVRIEVGYGLEGELTDAQSKIIIDQFMLPAFRRNDYDGGITAGTQAILKVMGGVTLTAQDDTQQDRDGDSGGTPWIVIVVFLIWIVFGRFLWPLLFLGGSRGRFGGGGFGGFGGGFGGGGGGGFSGGGGSFGGGGASGSW